MRVFRNREEAEKAGYLVNTTIYPYRVMKGNGADPHGPPPYVVRTDLEAKLAAALEAVEVLGNEDGSWECPQCGYGQSPPNEEAEREHAPDCQLAAVLREFRGEQS